MAGRIDYDAAMRSRRFGTFVGGIDMPEEKHHTREAIVTDLAVPPRLVVPLDPCRLGAGEPEVSVGQRVGAGDRLGSAGGRMPIFAPSGGVVVALRQCILAGGPTGAYDSPAVEIAELEAPAGEPPLPRTWDWSDASGDDLVDRIARGGVTTFADPLGPLADECVAARAAGVDTLVGNGMENQPYLTGEHRTLIERGEEVTEGLAILGRAIGAERVLLAVDARRTGRYQRVAASADGFDIQLLAVEHKYPVGHPVMLSKVVTGRKVPPGGAPTSVGVMVVNVAASVAACRCVAAGQPPTHRVLTVAGRQVGRPGNYRVALGTSAEFVLEAADAPAGGQGLCHGGPMTGVALPGGAAVSASTSGLLSLPVETADAPTACIRCAWCTDHCPVRLNVANLNDLFELGQIDRARRHHVSACLGCGVCSYICPARLALTHRMMRLKRALSAEAGRQSAEGAAGGSENDDG